MYRALCNTPIRIGSVPLVRLLGSFLFGEKTYKASVTRRE